MNCGVMAGLVPAIDAFAARHERRGCAGHRRAKATPFFERLCPRITQRALQIFPFRRGYTFRALSSKIFFLSAALSHDTWSM